MKEVIQVNSARVDFLMILDIFQIIDNYRRIASRQYQIVPKVKNIYKIIMTAQEDENVECEKLQMDKRLRLV